MYGHLIYYLEECPSALRERIASDLCAYCGVMDPLWMLHGYDGGPTPVRESTPERKVALVNLLSASPASLYCREITPEYDIPGELPVVEMGSSVATTSEPTINDLFQYISKYTTVLAGLRQKFTVILADGLTRDMPPGVVGNAYFNEASLVVGYYDIFEILPLDIYPPAIHYFGRSQCAFRITTDTTPPNHMLYRERVFEIPEFRKLQADLEAIMGPVKRCVYWQV